ncbi:MAG: 4-hydroxy-tetrahydrodipicolinate synthase [Phycisphaerales bacterium]|nr:MAG: 4-hydroxy-tetrahydrodipicolinate synthase [Phycisphaerales bacterium]
MTRLSRIGDGLRGSMTALVTPFRGGAVDWARLEALVDRQIVGGTDWLVPCGTTGESPTLSAREHDEVMEAVIAHSAGRCPVLAGTGSNNTTEAMRKTTHAASAGADAALVVAPYYNRPTPEGLYRHFAAIAEAADLPIVLYNVPARTGINIGNDVVVRLVETCPNVVAIKHATGSVDDITNLLNRCEVAVLSGDDSLTWPMMALGAVGVISVVGNLCPSLLKSLVKEALEGNCPAAQRCHRKVYDLAESIGRYGPNPLPIKTAMAICGLLEEEFRLPLCPLDAKARTEIEQVLRRHELIDTTSTALTPEAPAEAPASIPRSQREESIV